MLATTIAPQRPIKNVSEPLKALVGQGQNAKHVKGCTELCLGNQGIEQLAGFEQLTNLEVLWLNDNKLTAINNLDNNIRIKQLYAHNNMICTLKGSLLKFKFLSQLDLSGNQLRDLNKLMKTLQKLRFLAELNLQGNPCCEEPEYRSQLICTMPSLQVLDHHQVTAAERTRAAIAVGGQTHTLTVAFGTRLQQTCQQQATAGHNERSVLEQDLAKMAETIRDKQQQAAAEAEQALYAANPDAEYWAPMTSLPPPPGVVKAQQAWAAASNAMHNTLVNTTESSSGTSGGGAGVSGAAPWQRPGATGIAAAAVDQLQLTGSSGGGLSGSTLTSFMTGSLNNAGSAAGSLTLFNSYAPKDVLVLRTYKQRSNAVAGQAAAQSGANSKYLQGTFGHHLTGRQWEVESNALKL